MSAWIVSKHHIDQLVYGAIRLGVIKRGDALNTGRMLTRANVASIRARYGYDDRGAAAVKPYWYHEPSAPLSDVSLFKQTGCYDYQTCEYDGYPDSPAGQFVTLLTDALAPLSSDSPGYAEAPWGV